MNVYKCISASRDITVFLKAHLQPRLIILTAYHIIRCYNLSLLDVVWQDLRLRL